ncbi:MAG: hypothetical protein U1E42_08185 [Rhodospirillales bacterium]
MTPRSPDMPNRRRLRHGLVFAPFLCLVLAACTLHAGASHAASCLAGALSGWTGKSSFMVGAMMEDSVADAAPFSLRYVYLAGNHPDGGEPCQSCAQSCKAKGSACTGGNCNWWGCWQWDQLPPGAYVRDLISKAKQDGQIPVLTYYTLLQASGVGEGRPEITKLADAGFMRGYYNDFRFMLRQIGTDKAIVHVEPDLWGYGRQVKSDPQAIAAAVGSANPDCAGLPATMAGLGQCFVRMTRIHAPNAKIAFHASAWNAALNRNPGFDIDADARATARFMNGLGNADLVFVEADDRDSGWYQARGQNRWWDETDRTLPDFEQMFRWVKVLTETMGKPAMWWQVPVGNSRLGNTNTRWKDNRVDYFFANVPDLVLANSMGAMFGAGANGQTTPSTDGGNLASKMRAYQSGGATSLCR